MKVQVRDSWWRSGVYALRELRSGVSGFTVFLTCLILGVASIAAVGSITAAITSTIDRNAQQLLGGDAEVHTRGQDLPEDVVEFINKSGQTTRVQSLFTMSHLVKQDVLRLASVRAVDHHFPLYGEVILSPVIPLHQTLSKSDVHWGAAVDSDLFRQFGLALGDLIAIGDLEYQVRAVLQQEPDSAAQGIKLAPRVLVSEQSFLETGLVQLGSLVRYDYRVRLESDVVVQDWLDQFTAKFGENRFQLRSRADSVPGLSRVIERVSLFLLVVGFTSLVVGGVGVGNSIKAYLDRKREVIAIFKCLGATQGEIFKIYLLQVLILATAGIAVGALIGGLTPGLLKGLLSQWLPTPDEFRFYPLPILQAVVFGFCITLLFSIWPLANAVKLPAAGLLRSLVMPSKQLPGIRYILLLSAVAVVLLLTAIAGSTAPAFVFYCFLSLTFGMAVLGGLAVFLKYIASRMPSFSDPRIRIAIANIYRPGVPTTSMVISLGLGLTLFVAIALIHGNVTAQIKRELPASAPSVFFVDVLPFQIKNLAEALTQMPGVENFNEVAMVTARVWGVNGVPLDGLEKDVSELRNEQRIALMSELPPGNTVSDGNWWGNDYKGAPQISLSELTARRLDLKVGDAINFATLNGSTIDVVVANLRSVDWGSMNINFRFVVSPNTFADFPKTHVATALLDAGMEDTVYRLIGTQFPNVSLIQVREMIRVAQGVLKNLGHAVHAAALVTVLAGVLVLAGAIAASQRQRVYDAVILKVIGAQRKDILLCYLLEYIFLALGTSLVAVLLGAIAAYMVVVFLLQLPWVLLVKVVLVTVSASVLITVGLGLLGTWRGMKARPAAMLRTE